MNALANKELIDLIENLRGLLASLQSSADGRCPFCANPIISGMMTHDSKCRLGNALREADQKVLSLSRG